MGGDHQAQGHTQVLVNMIDFGMNVQEGGEAARVTHGNNGLQVESNVPESVRAALIQRGSQGVLERQPGRRVRRISGHHARPADAAS